MTPPAIAVVILNFNGKFFLEKFLPGILIHSSPHQVYVADNGSTDDSVPFLQKTFPSVKIIENKFNYGYAKGYNVALRLIKADYFILLNSDVEVSANWIAPVIDLMEKNRNIAACQPKLIDFKQRGLFEYAGASGGYIDKYCYPFCRGRMFNTLEKDEQQYNDACEIFWATGACLFVRSDAFMKAGGLDDDYFAHMEEIDLCWRLKNLGYKIYVQPASVVYHVGGGTLNKFSSTKTFLNFRNNLITLTKNHPPAFLFLKIVYRQILDGVAAFKFLSAGEPKHFLAVIRAHFSYYGSLGKTLSKRKSMKQKEGFRYDLSNVYRGNIVAEYFLKGKRTFKELKGGFFSEEQ
jgi:GT2 family glycosyltransferase